MRLLSLPLTLARLPFKIATAVLSTARGLVEPEHEDATSGVEHEDATSVVEQPQPRFFRQPPPARVDEPWQGYGRMNAADINARLRSEPAIVAAAVSLYEASGKGRSSVLEAAARRTRA